MLIKKKCRFKKKWNENKKKKQKNENNKSIIFKINENESYLI